MGDSDEEFDSRRSGREKFQRERPTDSGRDRRSSRDAWENSDRNRTRSDGPWNRRRDNENPRDDRRQRDRYSQSPPQKRARRDWDDRENGSYGGGGGYGGGGRGGHDRSYSVGDRGYGQQGGGGNWGGGGNDLRQHLPHVQPHPAPFGGGPMNRQPPPEPEFPCQPPMTPFKQFLSTQDDSISEEEAVKRYNQYKLEFKKTQLNEYFLAHKHEEWFKMKYHPEDGGKRKSELKANLQSRLSTFMKLYDMGKIDGTGLELDNIEAIIRVLDSAVVLMEGGGEEDLEQLAKIAVEDPEEEEGEVDTKAKTSLVDASAKTASKTGTTSTPKSPKLSKKEKRRAKKEAKKLKKKARRKKKKRKDSDDDDDDDDDSGSDSSDSSSSSSSSSSDSSDSDSDDDDDSELEEGEDKEDKMAPTNAAAPSDTTADNENGEIEAKAENNRLTLHRTQSIFIRNLAPNITKQEVEAMCTKYPGFMRVALQDPQSERKFFRRGWVTFNKTVNIKDICWNLNNIRLRDCELRAIVNRDLKQRVRPVSGLVNHKQAIKAYIKLAAKIIQNVDNRCSTWSNDQEDKKDQDRKPTYGLVSQNPVMKGITDYLVDEGSLEDELLGDDGEIPDSKNDKTELDIEKDEKMIAVLDRLVWYLRIVYSIDFYNGIEYPNEHEMPHRCGIIHARGVIPAKLPTQSELNEFITHFETKVKQFTDDRRSLPDSECIKLGKKDAEAEVEKFISTNTQELAKDKWLCPLSGKKFKGPEFVRKHIMSKHGEKIEEVKTEAMYFNAYLEDAKRPQLPEHPSNTARSAGPRRPPPGDMGPPQGPPVFGGHMMGHPPYGGGFRGGFRGGFDHFGGGRGYGPRPDPYNREGFRRPPAGSNRFGSGGRRDGRSLIQYTDLDAPDDDIF